MRRREWSIVWALVVVLGVMSSAAGAPVLQPNDPSISTEQRVALLRAADEIGRLLGSSALYASQRSLGAGGWTHAQFAAYTAGWVSAHGYQVLLASNSLASGAPDTWVLVEATVAGATFSIPVNASPQPGAIQKTLGSVPLVSGAFDPAFVTFDRTTSLPPNDPPAALALAALRSMDLGGTVFFFDGSTSSDPDGRVVLYIWTWSDGDQLAQSSPTASYTYRVAGTSTVTLTVVDAFGATATTTVVVDVKVASGEDRSPTPPPPCGCGG